MENIGPTSWVCKTNAHKLNIPLPEFETIWNMKPEFRENITIYGKTHEVPRWHKNYEFQYEFNGSPSKQLEVTPPEIKNLLTHIQDKISKDINGILVNWYNPEDYISYHSDSEKQLDIKHPIITVTLGEEKRKFVLKNDNSKHEYFLGHGDIFIMGGDTQKTHKHGLPRSKKYTERRISLTFRKFF
jgi:alkylated DNA repair dioxygenase AlkB